MDFLPIQWNSSTSNKTLGWRAGCHAKVPASLLVEGKALYTVPAKQKTRGLYLRNPSGWCFCLYSYAYGMWTCTSASSISIGAWRHAQGFGAWRWLAILWPPLPFFVSSHCTLHLETTVAFGLRHKGLFNRNSSGKARAVFSCCSGGIRSRDAHRGFFIDDLMGPVGSNTRGEQDAMWQTTNIWQIQKFCDVWWSGWVEDGWVVLMVFSWLFSLVDRHLFNLSSRWSVLLSVQEDKKILHHWRTLISEMLPETKMLFFWMGKHETSWLFLIFWYWSIYIYMLHESTTWTKTLKLKHWLLSKVSRVTWKVVMFFVSWKICQFYLWMGAISGFVMGTQNVLWLFKHKNKTLSWSK